MRKTLLVTLTLAAVGALSTPGLASPAPGSRGGCDDGGGRYYSGHSYRHDYRPRVVDCHPRPRVIDCGPRYRHYSPRRSAVRFNVHVDIHARGGAHYSHRGYDGNRYRRHCD